MPEQSRHNTPILPASIDCGVLLDLNKEIASLFGDLSAKDEIGRKTRMLANYPEFRIVLVTMRSGSRWNDHKTTARALIQVLRGQIRFHTAGGTFELAGGKLLALGPGILHSVDSVEDSAFLLTLSDVIANKAEAAD
jgi:quercetin dioxygenase-like cupin family protein